MSLGCVEVVPEAHHETLHEHVFEIGSLYFLHLRNVKIKEAWNDQSTNVFYVL
jgi:hypothetical protein